MSGCECWESRIKRHVHSFSSFPTLTSNCGGITTALYQAQKLSTVLPEGLLLSVTWHRNELGIVLVLFPSLTLWGSECVNEYYIQVSILHHLLLCLAHSVCFVSPFPSSWRVLTSSHACFWPLPIFFSVSISLVALCLLGQCAAYGNNHTRSWLYLASYLHREGKGGILPRALLACGVHGCCAYRTLFDLWLGECKQRRWLNSLAVSLANTPFIAGLWTGNVPANRDEGVRAFA